VGRQLTVLVEGESEIDPGGWAGTSCRYAPVELPADSTMLPGELVESIARRLANCGARIECEPLISAL
jgi:hypothetical protein